MEPISIPLSRGKIVLITIGSLAFVAICLWMWSAAVNFSRWRPATVRGWSAFGGVFFALCAIYGVRKLFDDRPGLVIDDEGFTDHSSGTAIGRVLWSDVVGIRVAMVGRQKFLAVDVSDAGKYQRRSSMLKRMLNSASTLLTGTPINIASNTLKIDFDEMHRLMVDACHRYHTASGMQSGNSGGSA